MLFCSCEAAEVCAAHWCLRPGPSAELWLCRSTGLTLKSAEATAVSCCQQMLGFRFAFLGNNEIHVQECRGDYTASCWVTVLWRVIHDFGAGGRGSRRSPSIAAL